MSRPSHPKNTRLGALALLGVMSCGEAEPAISVTEHLVVEPTDSARVCRGSLDAMEAQTVRVAETLGVDLPYPIHVYCGASAVEQHCSGSALGMLSGCARGLLADTYVATGISPAYHELVHAVRWVNGFRGPRFFEEGIAEVLSGFRPFVLVTGGPVDGVERGPELLARVPWGEFQTRDYSVAGHFMSWLFVTYGDEAVVAFLNDARLTPDGSAPGVDAAFSDSFGLSLLEAEDAWRSTAVHEYTWGEVCDPLRDLAWDGAVLEFTGRVDCDAPNTLGPSVMDSIRTRSNCFTLETHGAVRVELIASGGLAEFRSSYERCKDAGVPLSPEHWQAKKIVAGEALELPFAPCTWEIGVATDLEHPIDFTLRLTRL